jgi:hypothetical protein
VGQVLQPVRPGLGELARAGDQQPQVPLGGEHPVPGPFQQGEQRIILALIAGESQLPGELGPLVLGIGKDVAVDVGGLPVDVGTDTVCDRNMMQAQAFGSLWLSVLWDPGTGLSRVSRCACER